jgi:predicted N-acetyltransferase YhbS
MSENIVIRKMNKGDIPSGLQLSMAENWNQTEHDWEFLLKGPKNICLLAEQDGKIVGTTTAINYVNQVSWIGMVLVDQEYRGMGISKQLLVQTLEMLSKCSSIKLDATPAGQPVYKKIGFNDEYTIKRMTRLPGEAKKFVPVEKYKPVPLQTEHLEEATKMDKEVFGTDRGMLVKELARKSPELSWVITKNDGILGFCLGRPGSRYTQIGPVCALNNQAAMALISAAFKDLENRPVVVDIPEAKVDLIEWLESQGFIGQRSFTRMYLNENPFPGVAEKQFLICGPEFG